MTGKEQDFLSPYFRELVDLYEVSLEEQEKLELPRPRGETDSDLSLFVIIRSEIYKFFCEEDGEYKEARKDIGKDRDLVFGFICGSVGAAVATAGIAIPVAVLSAAVAIVLKTTITIGVRSLCNYVSLYGLDDSSN